MSRYVTLCHCQIEKVKRFDNLQTRSHIFEILCRLMSANVTLCHVMSRYVIVRYKKLKYLTTCKLVPIYFRSYVALCQLMSRYVTRYVLLCLFQREKKNEYIFLNNFLVTITDNYNNVMDITFHFK